MWNQENVVAVVMYCKELLKEDMMEDLCSSRLLTADCLNMGLAQNRSITELCSSLLEYST